MTFVFQKFCLIVSLTCLLWLTPILSLLTAHHFHVEPQTVASSF
jgi:hypothetical protein